MLIEMSRGGGLSLDIRFYMQKVVEHWSRLPKEVTTVPSLTQFQDCLDNALRPMV